MASLGEFIAANQKKDLLRFSAAGSVDDGKSTLIGRLLHDTKSIYEDHLQALASDSARVGTVRGGLDFALLTDGLRAEREQGITIDVAYRYFSTPKRNFIIADTPGHEQYTRNMATGASTANLAIILIDARHGPQTQTRRHAFIASLLGIPRLLVAVNKMDLVGFAAGAFDRIVAETEAFAQRLGVVELKFIPISALDGDNVVERSTRMPWYRGEPVLDYLENVYIGSDRNLIDFRLPVQSVIRPDLDFRGYAGQIASGAVRVGDEVVVLPAGRTTRVRSIVTFGGELRRAVAPQSITLTLEDEIDVSRGDVLVHARNRPHAQANFEAMVVWMAEAPMDLAKTYLLKHTTRGTRAEIVKVDYRVDVDTLSRAPARPLALNEIGRVSLHAHTKLFFDAYEKNRFTGSFILIDPDDHGTVAAGMIIDRLPESRLRAADAPEGRHVHAEEGGVGRAAREQLLGQRAVTLWLTGLSGSGKSSIARAVEKRLLDGGRHVMVLDGDNLRLGLNRDLGFSKDERAENIRRVAEVARLFNDAGTIAIVPVISPYREDRERARDIVGADRFIEVHVATPIAVCEARDRKGLYRMARAGEIEGFTGVSAPYEEPAAPFLRLQTEGRTLDESAAELLAALAPRTRLAAP